MAETVTVVVPGRVDPRLADDLAAELGVYPYVEESGTDRAVDVDAVVLVVYAAVATFTEAMVQQFGTEAATRLLQVFERLRQAAPSGQSVIRLVDEENQVVVEVGEEACRDARALPSLLQLERDVFRPGVRLSWDAAAGRWRPRRGEPVS